MVGLVDKLERRDLFLIFTGASSYAVRQVRKYLMLDGNEICDTAVLCYSLSQSTKSGFSLVCLGWWGMLGHAGLRKGGHLSLILAKKNYCSSLSCTIWWYGTIPLWYGMVPYHHHKPDFIFHQKSLTLMWRKVTKSDEKCHFHTLAHSQPAPLFLPYLRSIARPL